MGVDQLDCLIDAPTPCGSEAVARVAVLKTSDSIVCRRCSTAIDLTNPGTRNFIEEFSRIVASLLPRK
jgi:hypothetical protein